MLKEFALALGVTVGASTMIVPTYYPTTTVVTEVTAETVKVKTFSAIEYEMPNEGEDWIEGDLASLIMKENGTPNNITDDTVVIARYSGWIDNWKEWGR